MVNTITPFDSSLLINYYQAKLTTSTLASAAAQSTLSATAAAQANNSATANDDPPWETLATPTQQIQDAQTLSIKNFVDTTNVPLSAGASSDAKTEQDNQKLFSIYTAINNLAYLAKMSQRDGQTSGQLEGYNTRFQTGIQQLESYLKTTTFNNFALQSAATSSSVTSTATVPLPMFSYTTRSLTTDTNVDNALPGIDPSQSFTVSVKKGGVTTDVPIDLSRVPGTLNVTNIVSYVNQQLSAGGYATRLKKVITDGSIDDLSKASFGIQLAPSAGETVTFSSAAAQPALYLVGSTGSATATTTTTGSGVNATTSSAAADQQSRIVKLTNIDSNPQTVFTANAGPSSGTTNAQATAVDANGNVFVLGNATGDFASQINQGTQDTYLTKYDSAGNVQWTQLLGSADTASGYAMTLDAKGNPIITGATTADLTTTAVADGNNDSFVTKYDTNGNQVWTQQIPTLNANQSNAVSTDAAGNIYIGGQIKGVVAAGQTSAGGTDGYVAKLSSAGKFIYKQQFGTTGNDQVSATATASDGSLYVASVQNGHAIVAKYADGDATAAPVWQTDLGDLQNGGTIGSIAVSGNQVYLSGSTGNTNLTAGGSATIANASSGGSDAYVFNLTDNGSSQTANTVTYVGTGAQDQGGALTVGPDGTVYLAGTTAGTFAGQIRNVPNTSNAFVAAIGSGGALGWVRQYGGMDGQSNGAAVAIDPKGSSVLDALGLPTGAVNLNQSVDLTTATTLRAGDSFQMKISTGSSTRTTTITIDPGETLNSLATKINSKFGTTGTASVAYGSGGEGLKIAVNTGVSATLIAGPADSDALGRLGIAAGVITNAGKGAAATATATGAEGTQTYGLGLLNNMDISTAMDAGAARATLLNVLSNVRNIYQTTNTPATTSTGPANVYAGSTVPAYLTAQVASYNLALGLLTGASSNSTTSA